MSRPESCFRKLPQEVAQLQGLNEAPLRPQGAIQFGDDRRRLLGRISRSHGENDDSTSLDGPCSSLATTRDLTPICSDLYPSS